MKYPSNSVYCESITQHEVVRIFYAIFAVSLVHRVQKVPCLTAAFGVSPRLNESINVQKARENITHQLRTTQSENFAFFSMSFDVIYV